MLNHVSRRRARRAALGLAASGALLLGALCGPATIADATGGPPTPTAITAHASTDNTGLGGAVPEVLVTKGKPITLTVALEPYGAAFAKDTKLKLTPSLASGATPAGKVRPTSVIMPAGVNSAAFTMSYSAVDNGVQVTVSVANASTYHPVTPGTTDPFDVLKALTTFASDDPRLETGLGVGNRNCAATTTESECGTLVLSEGLASPAGALSLGACTDDLGCTPGSQVVQFVGDLGSAYSPETPAVLVIRCDKTLCAGKGVTYYTVKLSFETSGPLDLEAMPCVTKGVALDGYGNDYCVDYRQSHRDNAGDLLLYLLFTHDMRAST